MMHAVKESRIGLVVVKLSFAGEYFYLMRKNDKWKDYNFIGGHEIERDHGSLQRAANREFREEVPASRFIRYVLPQLTPVLKYGPCTPVPLRSWSYIKCNFF